nr:unnamed protein product [Rangifer tarandus platyrhynchus]
MGLLHNSEDRSILTPVFPPSLTDQWSAHSPCPRPQFQDSTQALQAEALIIPLFLAGCAPGPNSLLQDHLNPPTLPLRFHLVWYLYNRSTKPTTEVPTQRRRDSFLSRGLKEQWGRK